jgi:hypothetical protein
MYDRPGYNPGRFFLSAALELVKCRTNNQRGTFLSDFISENACKLLFKQINSIMIFKKKNKRVI